LALKNYYSAKYETAWSWLMQAVKADPIAPFMRLSLYKIAARTALKAFYQNITNIKETIFRN
jgi:hypothetical protein